MNIIEVLEHTSYLRTHIICNPIEEGEMIERFNRTFFVKDNQPKDLVWCKWYQRYADGMKIRGE